MTDRGYGWEWMPPPPEPDEHETIRAVRAAMAARDVLRLEHAMQRFRAYLDDLTVQGAPVALERVEDVVAQWAAAEGDGSVGGPG